MKLWRPSLRLLGRSSVLPFRNYAEAASQKEMEFTFASANQVFYDAADVKQIDVPSFSGTFGILPKHVPTLAVLSPGVVTVFEKDGSSKRIFVSSGTVSIILTILSSFIFILNLNLIMFLGMRQ